MPRLFTISFCLIIFGSALFNQVYCQSEIIYDFSVHGPFKGPKTVKEGETICYRIKNINPFYYDITINGKLYSVQGSASNILTSNLQPGSSSSNIPKPDTGSKSTTTTLNSYGLLAKIFQETDNKSLQSEVDDDILTNAIVLVKTFMKDKFEFDDLVKTYREGLLKLNNFLNIGKDFDALVLIPVIDGNKVKKDIKTDVAGYFNKGETDVNNVDTSFFAKKHFLDKSDELYNIVVKNYKDILEKNEVLRADSMKMMDYCENYSDNARIVDVLKIVNDQKKEAWDNISECADSYNKLIKIGKAGCEQQAGDAWNYYYKILNGIFEVRTCIQATSSTDIIKFIPVLKPKINSLEIPPIVPTWEVAVINGWRLDYSTGIIISGLVDDSYATIDTTFLKNKLVNNIPVATQVAGKYYYQNVKSKVSFSLVGMLHFYWRGSRLFGFGANLGVGLRDGITANLHYLFGASILIGADQRFLLNGGGTIGNVKRLDHYYKTHNLVETGDNTIPLVDKMEISWYVGLSYSLGSRKEVTQ